MTLFLLIGIIFFLAGFIQGMTGFGSALVAIPLLSLILEIKEAVPLCILVSVVITVYMSIGLKKHFHKDKILPLCIGSIPGILFGVTLLKLVPSDIMRMSLGIFLIAYALYNLVFTPIQRKLSNNWGYLAGFLSGSIGAAFSAGGPPTIIYTTLNTWSKDEIKATLTGFFLFNSICVAAAHVATGLTTSRVFFSFLLAAPFVLAGTAAGTRCYGYFRQDLYLKIIFLFLVIMGVMMVFG